MTQIEKQLSELNSWSESVEDNFLSIYADVNPARPENTGKGWIIRVKNRLKEIPEIRNAEGKRDEPFYNKALELLEQERPEARTLALFLHRDKNNKLHALRLDLQIDLPVVDIAHGHVDARFGAPYLTPLWYAADEYERTGILLLDERKWRFFEIYLGEIQEDQEIFAEAAAEDWQTLQELSRRLSSELASRAAKPGGRYDKLSHKERIAARVSGWLHKFYTLTKRLLEKTVDKLAIDRIVLIGESWQVSHFETYLNSRLQQKVIARLPLWPEVKDASPLAVWRKAEPAVVAHERQKELRLLAAIKEQPGIWGTDPVLDALHMGRVKTWVLPWSLEQKIWICKEEKYAAATEELARILCDQPELVPLREYALQLAADYGCEIDFVRGEAEQELLNTMHGMAALLRW
ncbi:MAG: hypothetical protein KatS3mg031_0616 [Chitinophagales bacterium]|nr:MAG: hypothetical protein KatS3mg031_0616 [Chitinophagales bacterium]